MCDYSLEKYESRPAKVGDKLLVQSWPTGTTGFTDATVEKCNMAVCLRPGTELAFAEPIKHGKGLTNTTSSHTTAVFCSTNEHVTHLTHHDALEFPDGEQVLLNHLTSGQTARVLQLPVSENEAKKLDMIEVEKRLSDEPAFID
jgi:hypothetical protein